MFSVQGDPRVFFSGRSGRSVGSTPRLKRPLKTTVGLKWTPSTWRLSLYTPCYKYCKRLRDPFICIYIYIYMACPCMSQKTVFLNKGTPKKCAPILGKETPHATEAPQFKSTGGPGGPILHLARRIGSAHGLARQGRYGFGCSGPFFATRQADEPHCSEGFGFQGCWRT